MTTEQIPMSDDEKNRADRITSSLHLCTTGNHKTERERIDAELLYDVGYNDGRRSAFDRGYERGQEATIKMTQAICRENYMFTLGVCTVLMLFLVLH